MKIMFISDIHGDIQCLKEAIDIFHQTKSDKLVILGDILYHGPRNDLPSNYAPKQVIEELNKIKEHILAIRGNCDTEVDQMVLQFPILADYAYISADGLNMLLTHGHKFNALNPPPLAYGDILLCGHTHVYKVEKFGNNNTYINPGSITLPKENNPRTYMIYESKKFEIYDFSNIIVEKTAF